jgi:hypothetical protein
VNWLDANAHDCYVAVAGLNPAPITQPFGKFFQFFACWYGANIDVNIWLDGDILLNI